MASDWDKLLVQPSENFGLEECYRSNLSITVVRGYLTRKHYGPELAARQKAVPLIQAQIRGYIQRKRYHEYRKQAQESAVNIQRGGSTRCRLDIDVDAPSRTEAQFRLTEGGSLCSNLCDQRNLVDE